MYTLEQRIEQLEKQNRFYRICFITVLILACAGVFMSFDKKEQVQDTIKARNIHVVDNSGNVIVELTKSTTTNNGEINTYTPAKKILVSLFTSSGGSGAINTFNAFQQPVFKVTQTTGGSGYMALLNSDMQQIVEFGATDNEGGYMRINDKEGNKRAWITYTEGGGGYFSLSNGKLETFRVSTPAAGARLGLYNKNNTRIAYMGAEETQNGNLSIYNSSGSKLGSIPQ